MLGGKSTLLVWSESGAQCWLTPQWWRYPLSSRQCIELPTLLSSVEVTTWSRNTWTDRWTLISKMTCFVLVPHHSRLNRTGYIMHESCEFFAHAILLFLTDGSATTAPMVPIPHSWDVLRCEFSGEAYVKIFSMRSLLSGISLIVGHDWYETDTHLSEWNKFRFAAWHR